MNACCTKETFKGRMYLARDNTKHLKSLFNKDDDHQLKSLVYENKSLNFTAHNQQ